MIDREIFTKIFGHENFNTFDKGDMIVGKNRLTGEYVRYRDLAEPGSELDVELFEGKILMANLELAAKGDTPKN